MLTNCAIRHAQSRKRHRVLDCEPVVHDGDIDTGKALGEVQQVDMLMTKIGRLAKDG